jgi:hypothetical protein
MNSRDFVPRAVSGVSIKYLYDRRRGRNCNDGDIKKAVIAGATAIKRVKGTLERERRMMVATQVLGGRMD